MEQSLLQWILGQTGLAGIAALALWMLKQVYEERLAERERFDAELQRTYEERLSEQRQHREDVQQIVQETRACIERNTEVLMKTLNEIRNLARAMTRGS